MSSESNGQSVPEEKVAEDAAPELIKESAADEAVANEPIQNGHTDEPPKVLPQNGTWYIRKPKF